MSEDSFSEVTSQSWFGRIGGAIKGILFGVILFVVAFPLLFWNEGRAVKRYKTLKEGAGAVVPVTAESVEEANAGQLVHMTAQAATDAVLTDSVFGVSVNAIKLKRVVEMFQWTESTSSKTKKKLGGGSETVKTYSYSTTWSEKPINSSSFKQPADHQNPGAFAYESAQQVAGQVMLGAFMLSSSLVAKINNFESFPVPDGTTLPDSLVATVKPNGGGFYIGADPASAQVGDTRVTFEVARPAMLSVIAKQTGNSFSPYITKVGGTIELLQIGTHSADAMIMQAQRDNAILTWVLRVVGFVLMLAGLVLVFRPLSVLADVLPILGSIVGAGTGIIALLLAGMLSLTTIAIAWIVYRPLLGIVLMAVAVGLAWGIKTKLKGAKTGAEA